MESRRRFLVVGATALGGLLARSAFATAPAPAPAEGVTPNEDLMREHGVLRRLLLVYEEVGRRAAGARPSRAALAEAAGMIRHFVEDYHEKLEEDYIFPAFEKTNRLADLTAILRAQHQAGRSITAQLEALAERREGESTNARLRTLLAQFVRMYRPHAAREDTVLFPAFPGLVGHGRYDELGDLFEDRERQLFGENGFERMVAQVQGIEQQLGIYRLEEFTPRS